MPAEVKAIITRSRGEDGSERGLRPEHERVEGFFRQLVMDLRMTTEEARAFLSDYERS